MKILSGDILKPLEFIGNQQIKNPKKLKRIKAKNQNKIFLSVKNF